MPESSIIGGPHRAAVFLSNTHRSQLKRRLIASWGSNIEQAQAQSGSSREVLLP